MQRLVDELDEDGVVLPDDVQLRWRILDELDHARRPPVHETRRPLFGAFVLPADRALLVSGDLVEIRSLEGMDLERARQFADGRSSFLVHQNGDVPALAYFRRSVQYEADLVNIQHATDAHIVQRTLLGQTRLFTTDGVVDWNGRSWSRRPNASALLPPVSKLVPTASWDVLRGLLELCIHWLSPSHVGATMVLRLDDDVTLDTTRAGLDVAAAFPSPALSVRTPHHASALHAALTQTDLATVVDSDGAVRSFAVGLNASARADRLITDPRGMRHRSARRYTFDHPEVIAFVVSEDGPVTVFSDGAAIATCDVTHADWPAMKADPASDILLQRCVACDKLLATASKQVRFGSDACPVCGATDGLIGRRVVAVKKEWQPTGAGPRP
jgi:DNA integrity scanning protein DisA with diadenylate cyclase activity/predicted RNA-binding Zn-ribbon protein involved in translation (DUF1610 family)